MAGRAGAGGALCGMLLQLVACGVLVLTLLVVNSVVSRPRGFGRLALQSTQ